MVFESRVGETFLLGASTWRIEQITHDRVLVSPAPGEPGKMPFWKADAAGRPLELGRYIGEMVRALGQMPAAGAVERLVRHHDLDHQAAENLIRYLNDQKNAVGVVPDDQTILIERCRDELGDWRICVLTPFGGKIHAPWAMAVVERTKAQTGQDVETMWTDDGFVVRFPETEEPPDPRLMVPSAEEVESLVLKQLGGTALFAAKFREAAGRALLLPKRRPGGRSPLWQQRKRAADLLAVAARFGSFPMLLEAYRECLRDVFDIPSLVSTLRRIEMREVRTVTVDSAIPSPFASALLFTYVANYLYDGDAPLAERRAQALAIDQVQLKELLGEAELRELLDADALADVEAQLQQLDEGHRAKSVDGVHDLLLRCGDLTVEEIQARSRIDGLGAAADLVRNRRAIYVTILGESRIVPIEYAGRYRDALGVPLPQGLPESLLEPSPHAAQDLTRRYARTHGPFTTTEFAGRYGLGRATAETLLKELSAAGRLLEGEFRPGGSGREWCDPDVLQSVRRRSLAKLRRQVEPVEPPVLGRLITSWQGVVRRRPGLDALLDAIDNLQGVPLPASIFETEILAARVEGYNPSDLDTLTAAGEVVWSGLEPLGERDGRLALYLTDNMARLHRPIALAEGDSREPAILDFLDKHGASFFSALHEAAGGGYPGETVDALWDLVWKGAITNDTFHALRAFTRPPERRRKRSAALADPARRRAPGDRRPAFPEPPGRTAIRRRAVVARQRARVVDGHDDRAVDGAGAAAPLALRRPHSRGGGRGRHLRRFQRRLRRVESDGGCRTDPSRLFRERCRRDAIRASGGARFVAVAEGAARGGGGRPARRNRPGQSIRDDSRVAGGQRSGGCRTRADAVRRRARRARERRAQRLHQPRRPSAAGVPARGRARSVNHGTRSRPTPGRTGPAHRRDQRRSGARASPRTLPRRGRVQPVGNGISRAAWIVIGDVDPIERHGRCRSRRPACLRGTRYFGRPEPSIAR